MLTGDAEVDRTSTAYCLDAVLAKTFTKVRRPCKPCCWHMAVLDLALLPRILLSHLRMCLCNVRFACRTFQVCIWILCSTNVNLNIGIDT